MEILDEKRCVPIDLSTHDRYLALLDALEGRTAYIMLVPVADQEDETLQQARRCMELAEQRTVDRWPGTITSGGGNQRYIFAASGAFFDYLRQFSAFFFRFQDSWGCGGVSDTGFGDDDIAFLDETGRLLFFTTTHEGYANGLPELLNTEE